MRLLLAAIAVSTLLSGSLALAQERGEKVAPGQERKAVGLTPEMRAYLDEVRRQDEPKMNAKRAAMQKAEQRRMRLAAQAWYGYSNLRPIANPCPTMSSYSPMWAGSSTNEFYWYGTGGTPYTVYVDQHVLYHR
jgi:hypothetical protein